MTTKSYTPAELSEILKSHADWLAGKAGGKRADLANANLTGANLTGANLTNADLYKANLSGANLFGAYLSGANLFGAYLSGADLPGADLTDANLTNADLTGAKLSGALLPDFQLCPQTDVFTGWKKVRGDFILELEIQGPRTSSLVGKKCRTSKARVVAAYGADGTLSDIKEFQSMHDSTFKYRVGEVVEVPDYDPDIRVECTRGVHFFMTREEAEKYVY